MSVKHQVKDSLYDFTMSTSVVKTHLFVPQLGNPKVECGWMSTIKFNLRTVTDPMSNLLFASSVSVTRRWRL